MFDQFSFSTLRIIFMFTHFVLTSCLLWTKQDSLQVTLSFKDGHLDYKNIENQYDGLISFGLFLIVAEFVVFAYNHGTKSFSSAIHLLLDIIASFFIAWIILDGLDWRTYIYILSFCL